MLSESSNCCWILSLKSSSISFLASVLTESVQKSLEKNSYGKTVTVKVSVEKDNSGKYGLSDTEMSKLETAMFPTE